MSYPGQAFFWTHNPRIRNAEETFERNEVVTELLSWVGTPYHMGGQVKGAGADCATLLLCVWRACGIVPPEIAEFRDDNGNPFQSDWFQHTSAEKYLRHLLRFAHKTAEAVSFPTLEAKPGNIVLTRAVRSRVFNHGGIVVKWPRIVHAVDPAVQECDATSHCLWSHQAVVVFDPFERPLQS